MAEDGQPLGVDLGLGLESVVGSGGVADERLPTEEIVQFAGAVGPLAGIAADCALVKP